MRDIYNISLLDILPSSLTADERIRAAAQAIDVELLKVTNEIKKLPLLYAVDDLDEAWVDELAWQLHVDFYDKTLPVDQKRALVKNSDAWHRRKGTPSAVEELIASIFGDGTVEEWFDYGGTPYRFRVNTSNDSATAEKANQFLKAVNSVKNTRSTLDKVVITITENMNLYIAGVLHMGDHITVKQVV